MAINGKYTLPDDLLYDRDSHLWLRPDGNLVYIGLDLLGQASMGDMAYVALDAEGKSVERGDPVGSLEAAKMVAPILAPISGRLVKRNEAVSKRPRLLAESPYDKGWMIAIEPIRWDEESRLLVGGRENVNAFLVEQVKQYKDQGWID